MRDKRRIFIGKYNPSVILTFIGMIFAASGICCTLRGEIRVAMIMLVICGICDLFDGKIARMFKRDDVEKRFGVELDSLADTVCFIAFPAVIFLKTGSGEWYDIIPAAFYTIAGVERLGYFNITADSEGPVAFYSGMPVTCIAAVLPITWLIGNALPSEISHYLWTAVITVCALLFITFFIWWRQFNLRRNNCSNSGIFGFRWDC